MSEAVAKYSCARCGHSWPAYADARRAPYPCPRCGPDPRPPLGISPRHIWMEQAPAPASAETIRERLLALLAASTRFVVAGKIIPVEWILEIAEHHQQVGAQSLEAALQIDQATK